MPVKIIINTRGRVTNQVTLFNLHEKLRELVTVVCYPGEMGALCNNFPNVEVIEHPDYLTNLSQVRHWCIDYFNCNIIFMDDNINFSVRRKSEFSDGCEFLLNGLLSKYFRDETILDEQLNMFNWIIEKLESDKYGLVGISYRLGNNRINENVLENKRIFAFWGINKELYNKHCKKKIDDVILKQDFYINLEFLTNGIPNIVNYKYAFNKPGGINKPGGCSIYRNIEIHNQGIDKLKNAFPNFVKIREKSVKSWKGDFEGKLKALDVTCYWKKAYEWGLKKNKI